MGNRSVMNWDDLSQTMHEVVSRGARRHVSGGVESDAASACRILALFRIPYLPYPVSEIHSVIDLLGTWSCSCHGVGMYTLTVRHVELGMSIDSMMRVHIEAIIQLKEDGQFWANHHCYYHCYHCYYCCC